MKKKENEQLLSRIEKHYEHHGAHIRLKPIEYIEKHQRFIFHVKLKPGTRVNLVFDRAPDIRAALEVPLFQPFEEKNSIYLAVSTQSVKESSLRKMLSSKDFRESSYSLPIALGYDLMGRMYFDDLAKMPHAMYIGSTNSGKSTGLYCLILSLLTAHSANEVSLLIFDIGDNSMDMFTGIPHLSAPIVKDHKTGIHVISELVTEMERRYSCDRNELSSLPSIICVMDEYVSFISGIDNKKQQQALITDISSLLNRGRKVDIHMVLATHNPTNTAMLASVGNITSRMTFACAKHQTSTAAMNTGGAENLRGKGAMMYKSMKHPEPIYLQGAFMSNAEIEQLLKRIKAANYGFSNQFLIPDFIELESPELPDTDCDAEKTKATSAEKRKELADVIMWALGRITVAADNIKTEFNMGNRVKTIMERLFEMGIISEKNANHSRKVCPQSVEEIREDTVNFLVGQGYTREKIVDAIAARYCEADDKNFQYTENNAVPYDDAL